MRKAKKLLSEMEGQQGGRVVVGWGEVRAELQGVGLRALKALEFSLN